MSNTHIVQACFDAYLAQDRDPASALLADDYVFTGSESTDFALARKPFWKVLSGNA